MANFRSGLIQFGRSDIGRALAISLTLHAMLLLQTLPGASRVGSQRGPTPTGISLEATLHGRMAPPAQTPILPTGAAATNAPAPHRKPLSESMPRASHSSTDLRFGSAGTAEVPAASMRLSSGPETLAPVLSAAMPGESAEAGADVNGLRQYRLSLALESRRFKRYPQEALEQRWSGTAQVRVAIAASGVPQSVELLNSSGHQVLDAVALDMLGKAALTAAVPVSLRGRPFSVPLPVEFRRDPE